MRETDIADVSWREVRQVAFAWIDSLDQQRLKRPRQVAAATAVLFLLVCDRFGLEPRRVLETAERVIRRARDLEPQYVRGIEEYLRHEVADG